MNRGKVEVGAHTSQDDPVHQKRAEVPHLRVTKVEASPQMLQTDNLCKQRLCLWIFFAIKSNGHSQHLTNFRGLPSSEVNAAQQAQLVLAHSQLHCTDVGRSWGKVIPVSCKKNEKPQMKEKRTIPKAASNRAGFHPAFWVASVWWTSETHLNGSCSLLLQFHDFSFWSLYSISDLFAYSWREKELIIYFSFWNPVCGLDFTTLKLLVMSCRAPDYFINMHFCIFFGNLIWS